MSSWFKLGICVLGCGVLGSTAAAPAPWYWWSSKINAQRVCAQFMPSQGWERLEGPFHNPRCVPQPQRILRGH